MLEPRAFPTAVSVLPARDAVALTTISGAEEPIATIVKPIIMGETPMFLASADAPYTNLSALQLSTNSPTKNMTRFIITICFYFVFY
ncbi:hypothetical protein GCM10007852_37590 [Agaribacter marinus]|uniref:Uncharacterized protein n=1 Tax=Agaribacter marinus TaxID=1431249 RepID=A0AA37T398_9ALTE|nr:hypothetical protein GCM10007852_37590 [Agaribacter marinus]